MVIRASRFDGSTNAQGGKHRPDCVHISGNGRREVTPEMSRSADESVRSPGSVASIGVSRYWISQLFIQVRNGASLLLARKSGTL